MSGSSFFFVGKKQFLEKQIFLWWIFEWNWINICGDAWGNDSSTLLHICRKIHFFCIQNRYTIDHVRGWAQKESKYSGNLAKNYDDRWYQMWRESSNILLFTTIYLPIRKKWKTEDNTFIRMGVWTPKSLNVPESTQL